MTESMIRILLVEDNATNRTFLALYLRRKGYLVEEACNGFEAMDFLSKNEFDVVFMDIQMPGLDGVETTRKIRRDTSGKFSPDIPIIAMTAHTMKKDREYFLSAGMDYYVAKPIELEQLSILAKEWAGIKRTRGVPDYLNAPCPSERC